MSGKVNLFEKASDIQSFYEYMKVGQLNDHMLNIVKVENRTLDFHVHEDSDEMFYIIEGKMQIEFSDKIIELNVGDFIIVPKGTAHRPVCTTPVTCLLIEKLGTLSNDNCGATYSKQ